MKYVIIALTALLFIGCSDAHKAPDSGTLADVFLKKYGKDSRYFCSENMLLRETINKNGFGYYFTGTSTIVVDKNSAVCKD